MNENQNEHVEVPGSDQSSPEDDTSQKPVEPQASAEIPSGLEAIKPGEALSVSRPDRDIFGRTPKNAPDWSHRRGEPRVFALLWTLYLMAAVIVTFMQTGPIGVFSPEAYRPAATRLFIMLTIGIVVLWPLVRLSQKSPLKHPGRAVMGDLIVLLIPVQALIWPQLVLAGWSLEVMLAVSCVMTSASITAGAAIVLGMLAPRPLPRLGIMALLLVWVLGVPLLTAMGAGLGAAQPDQGAALEPIPGWMFSPLSAVAEILRDRSWTGHPASVSPEHWRMIGMLVIGGICAWAGATAARLALTRSDA